ncbi:kinase-like protein [Cylindrobasidium torrendii FP15055 ss-10]|uniref:Kinase-like protein n=1 Tax=Cylindrobasidium torrendii FP15055 ss-10 TaxID=1314674 RepID=A0A0D7B8C8_9AGAR|nr:kinase-like protein [Cylindrobasidium torrendii FP15055 ss-10]
MSCCISDFGLSFPTEFTLTSHRGDVPGTIRFMAPEVLSPPEDIDFKILRRKYYDTPARDVYSFGCVIAEIYTADEPFSWLNNSGQITVALCLRHFEPWRVKPASITPELWDLARRCWSTQPAERPSTGRLYSSLEILHWEW